MQWLNYHHLHYFWVVAREGGLIPAGKVLRVSHPTLSAQIRALEERLGEKLFSRERRRLELTEHGKLVYRYAEEIFSLGKEMLSAVEGRSTTHPLRFDVGIADVVEKTIVKRLLEPALELSQPLRMVCAEDRFERLLADLAMVTLDLVISDAAVPTGSSVRAYSHLLGESGITFFATAKIARKLKRGFPASLDGERALLPLENLTLRRSINQWMEARKIRPHVVAEFEDSALLKVFGAEGVGFFPAPSVVEREVAAQYGVEIIGRAKEVRERYYVISAERRIKHPAVLAITRSARKQLFRS